MSTASIFDNNPHRLYRYIIGSVQTTKGVSGAPGKFAAKCRCGWEGVGEDAIREHQQLADGWTPRTTLSTGFAGSMGFAGARNSDPDTSHAAAGRTPGRRSQMMLLLRTYQRAAVEGGDGLTNEEAGIASGLAEDPTCCYWKRCSELRQMGYLEPTGSKRLSRANRAQAVNTITQTGIDLLNRGGTV